MKLKRCQFNCSSYLINRFFELLSITARLEVIPVYEHRCTSVYRVTNLEARRLVFFIRAYAIVLSLRILD